LLIVNAQDKVERRFVELGVLQGKERVVRSGIEAGTRVINDGAFRAPPGTAVNAVAADNAGAGQP
ncbi:efflux transporter periplasmic adaptor subunit, partial [Pseudomonas aeruginosa]|nr:efflux transporter periplasmic adaptor subunit [Pseudomonas aeruginosa]